MQSGKPKTSYFERLFCKIHSYTQVYLHMYTHMYKNTYVEIVIVNCQIQLFLDNMVLANQNAKLTGPDQGFPVSLPGNGVA